MIGTIRDNEQTGFTNTADGMGRVYVIVESKPIRMFAVRRKRLMASSIQVKGIEWKQEAVLFRIQSDAKILVVMAACRGSVHMEHGRKYFEDEATLLSWCQRGSCLRQGSARCSRISKHLLDPLQFLVFQAAQIGYDAAETDELLFGIVLILPVQGIQPCQLSPSKKPRPTSPN